MRKTKTNPQKYQLIVILAIALISIIYLITITNNQPKTTNTNTSDYLAKGNFPQNQPRNPNLNGIPNFDVPFIPVQFQPPQLKVTLSGGENLYITCIRNKIQNDVFLYTCTGRIYFLVEDESVNQLGYSGTLEIIDAQGAPTRQVPLPIRAVKRGMNMFTVTAPTIDFDQWNIRVCNAGQCARAQNNGQITTRIIE